MKYLEKFENFKYESVNEENIFAEVGPPLAGGLVTLWAVTALAVQDPGFKGTMDLIVKPFKKVVNFLKTSPAKIKNSVEDAASSIQSIGMEDEAVKWITDNLVNNKELQEELKSIDAKVEEINNKMSVLNKRKEGSNVSKSHHLDQVTSNNQKLLNSLEDQKKSVAMRAKGLLNQLQLDNKPLYKALMSSMEKLKQDNQLLSIMTERFRIKI